MSENPRQSGHFGYQLENFEALGFSPAPCVV